MICLTSTPNTALEQSPRIRTVPGKSTVFQVCAVLNYGKRSEYETCTKMFPHQTSLTINYITLSNPALNRITIITFILCNTPSKGKMSIVWQLHGPSS